MVLGLVSRAFFAWRAHGDWKLGAVALFDIGTHRLSRAWLRGLELRPRRKRGLFSRPLRIRVPSPAIGGRLQPCPESGLACASMRPRADRTQKRRAFAGQC